MSNIRRMPPAQIVAEYPRRIGFRISMVQIAIFADLTPRMNALGLTSPSRLTALVHIAARPGCSQSDLAVHTGLSRASAMTMTDQLEGAGIIERRGGKDARTHGLHITAAGSEVLSAALEQSAQNEERFFGILNDEERALLASLLERVITRADALREKS